MIIFLIRHGETPYNVEKRYQGTCDIPLSDVGRRKLRESGEHPPRVYVTPLKRTQETASILFPHAEQIVVPGLREMNFGAFEGRNYLEMEQDPCLGRWLLPGQVSRRRKPGRILPSDLRRIFSAGNRSCTEKRKCSLYCGPRGNPNGSTGAPRRPCPGLLRLVLRQRVRLSALLVPLGRRPMPPGAGIRRLHKGRIV